VAMIVKSTRPAALVGGLLVGMAANKSAAPDRPA
jgi:hypothetical protein